MQAVIASDFAVGHISYTNCYWCMATVAAPDCLDFFYKNVVSFRSEMMGKNCFATEAFPISRILVD